MSITPFDLRGLTRHADLTGHKPHLLRDALTVRGWGERACDLVCRGAVLSEDEWRWNDALPPAERAEFVADLDEIARVWTVAGFSSGAALHGLAATLTTWGTR